MESRTPVSPASSVKLLVRNAVSNGNLACTDGVFDNTCQDATSDEYANAEGDPERLSLEPSSGNYSYNQTNVTRDQDLLTSLSLPIFGMATWRDLPS